MDVFLVPVGADEHELYCEAPIEGVPLTSSSPRSGWWRRQLDRFRQVLAEAEEERQKREGGVRVERRGLWRGIMRRVAEAIAEQRLLWRLRTATAARLIHADDLNPDRAVEVARAALQRDFEKHRRWMIIDGLLFVVCAPLTLIPGPNIPALYFTFRTIGHYFSMRGARQGLDNVAWQTNASSHLTALRDALRLDSPVRHARVQAIARALGLDRLPAFIERVATQSS